MEEGCWRGAPPLTEYSILCIRGCWLRLCGRAPPPAPSRTTPATPCSTQPVLKYINPGDGAFIGDRGVKMKKVKLARDTH